MEAKRRCLVLMPFAPKYREVYEQVYKPTCASNGLDCWRVDEAPGPGSITKDIINGIIDAELLIADLTSRNANVFYELGIAHAVGNKTIMTAQSTEDIPFDIGNYRVLVYEQTISGATKLQAQLDAAIKEVLHSPRRPNNPVQDVFTARSITLLTRKKLLIEVVNIAAFRKGFCNLIEAEKLLHLEDLDRLNLEEMKAKHQIGPSVLSEITGLMLHLGLGDRNKIFFLATKHHFSPVMPSSAIL